MCSNLTSQSVRDRQSPGYKEIILATEANNNPQTPLQPAAKNTKNLRNSSTDNLEGGTKTPSREKDVEDTPVPKHHTKEKRSATTGTNFKYPNKQTNNNRTVQIICF